MSSLLPSSVSSSASASLATSSPASIASLIKCSCLAAKLLRASNYKQCAAALLSSIELAKLASELARAAGNSKSLMPTSDALPAENETASPAKMTFVEFTDLVASASPVIRSLPVISVESFEKRGANILGAFGHQYVVVGVLTPNGRPTYIRLDLYSLAGTTQEGPCALRVSAHDDHRVLAQGQRRLAALGIAQDMLENARDDTFTSGPSLDALVCLMRAIDGRVGRGYGPLGSNCWWMVDLVVYGLARGFAGHWLAHGGKALVPGDTLRRYMRGELGALAAGLECSMPGPENSFARWLVHGCGTVVRGIQTLATRHDQDRFVMHDEEVTEVVAALGEFVPAASPSVW